MKKWTWTCLIGLGLMVGACGSDAGEGTTDGDTALDIEIFVPDLVQVDLVEETSVTDVVEVVEPPKPGEFGYACDEALDCNSGWCVQTADGRQCTQTCVEACPSGYECREAPGVDPVFICLPKFLNLCDPCREAADCNAPGTAGNYCLAYGAKGRFCGAECNTDPDCPGGYVCRNVPVGGGQEAKQCVPVDGAECTCSPFAKQLQKATVCFDENDNGKCEGTRFCLQSGLSLCDAATPFPESCNGRDDNCDTVTDEFPPGYVCEITNDIGTCPGVGTCIEGVESCEGNAPKLDNNCDGIDDDCDGSTDEEACNDGNACTNDLCATGAGGELICTYSNDNQRLCDDGNGCTAVDRCFEGTCVGSEPKTCDDLNPCTVDSCDPITGECVFTPATANTPCDIDACTVGEFCDGLGTCVGGTPKVFVPKSQGGCIEEGGTYHQDCQSYQCVGAGVCVPGHHTRRDFDCRIGDGTCSTGKCGTDGRCGSTVPANTDCNYPGGVPTCKKGQCVGFECSLRDTPGLPCGTVEACPPCLDFISCAFCAPDVPGICASGGQCVPNFTGVTCSASCPSGQIKICGVCVPYDF